MNPLQYLHVDVFAPRAYSGNSLPVFIGPADLEAGQMLAITRELRHFEAIFLTPTDRAGVYRTRVFDLFDELPFAGHPIIGAAAALHHTTSSNDVAEWTFELPARAVTVATSRTSAGYSAQLDQGEGIFFGESKDRAMIAGAFALAADDLNPALPIAIVSTGLRYLIVPVKPRALERATIRHDITDLVTRAGAEYAVLFDEAALEVRHWNNDGVIEDVATGSAAGTIGAYRLRYCGAKSGETFLLNQGRFTGRPSQIEVQPHGTPDSVHRVKVGGHVMIVGRGTLEARP